jgi:hypothetical protein
MMRGLVHFSEDTLYEWQKVAHIKMSRFCLLAKTEKFEKATEE